MIYGYARVSTHAQDLASQREQLKAAGTVKVFEEKASGSTRGRTVLAHAILTMPGVRKPKSRIAERQLSLRTKLWPLLSHGQLWTRQSHDGFSTETRTMPLIMSIMDDLQKGKHVSSTYFVPWVRALDESFVTLTKQREMAFASGFTKQRGERTRRERMTILAHYGFIDIQEGPSGPMSYALIYNPIWSFVICVTLKPRRYEPTNTTRSGHARTKSEQRISICLIRSPSQQQARCRRNGGRKRVS